MVLKYSETFTATDPLSHEAVTALVDLFEAEGSQSIVIRSLEGEYGSREEYLIARDQQGNPYKGSSSLLPLTLSGAQRLVDALIGALQAAGMT